MYPFLLLLVAYVIGSVPSGLIVGRVFFNTDLRDYGSKNIGATNAYRVLGAPAGLCVLIADVGKGFWAYISVKRPEIFMIPHLPYTV